MAAKFKLPMIDNLMDLTEAELSIVSRYGFCYAKTPGGEGFQSRVKRTRDAAFDFFRKSKSHKNRWKTTGTSAGYADRRESQSKQDLEQCFFTPCDPIEPFFSSKKDIMKITDGYVNEMAVPLLKQLFDFHNLSSHFEEATKDIFQSFAFCYYPQASGSGMTPHCDTGLLTVLDVSQESLEVFIEGKWRLVPPIMGYTAVILSSTLSLMTGGNVARVLHRVSPPKSERLSFGLFINCCLTGPIIDYTTKQVSHENAGAFIAEEFNAHYNPHQ